MKTGLAHVCIETKDLDTTEQFYAVLGLKRQFEFRNLQKQLVGFYLAFPNGTYLEVIKSTNAGGEGVIKHFAIEVDDVEQAYQRLSDAGFAVTSKEYASDKNWMITTRDPNGIFIELQQYTEKSMQYVGGCCEVDYQP